MTDEEAALQGVFVLGAVARQMLDEKDEAIERLEAAVERLERELAMAWARIEELSNGVAKEAA